jgi:DNA end-binding protein Ku
MARRSSWDGFLRLNLISVPVRAYSAAAPGHGKIAFHQIHAKCHSRIRYKKACPIHGEVSNDEIVSGYEYAKGEYVLIDPKELAKLRTGSDKVINIDAFVHPEALDPMYFTDRSYYLAPDGKVGQKPYAVVQQVMATENRHAIGTMVLAGREQVVLIRPLDKLLTFTLLSYAEQFKKPSAVADEVADVAATEEELRLAKTLVAASTAKHFDFDHYRDKYTDEVSKLIEAKAAGKKVVAVSHEEAPPVINLMDALRRSLEQTQRGPEKEQARPGKKIAKSRRAGQRRKTG